jgi:abortive infection bacteriophage resistance protein
MKEHKGVTFNLMDEERAMAFLSERNYYFKLKAFAKNYEKYQTPPRQEQYINLDFGHLVELSRLDKELRALVLVLTLDIEHYLKVRIDSSAMRHGVDRYGLVEQYLRQEREKKVEQQLAEIEPRSARCSLEDVARRAAAASECDDPRMVAESINGMVQELSSLVGMIDPDYVTHAIGRMVASPYSKGLVDKYTGAPMPYWVLLELMTFGNVVSFYRSCFSGRDSLIDDAVERAFLKSVNPFLRCVVTLRNAAAHNDCLLNGLSNHNAQLRSKKRILGTLREDYGMRGKTVSSVGSVRIAVDLASTLICYDLVVPKGQTSAMAARQVRLTAERFGRNAVWFSRNSHIYEFLGYLDELLAVFEARLAPDGTQDEVGLVRQSSSNRA